MFPFKKNTYLTYFFFFNFLLSSCVVKLNEEFLADLKSTEYSAQFIFSCLPYLNDTSYLSVGSGSASNPYLICNAAQLNSISSNDMSASFKLMSDIDLGAYDGVGGNPNFNTIAQTTPFSGVFDGNGYKIQNLKTGTALFRETRGATIKNLTIHYFETTRASLVQTAYDTSFLSIRLNNNSVVSTTSQVGGVTAVSWGGIYRDVHLDGLTLSSSSDTCGGVIGQSFISSNSVDRAQTIMTGLNISNVSITTCTSNVGGLVGFSVAGGLRISDSTISGLSITSGAAMDYVGGVIGYSMGVIIENVQVIGDGDSNTYEISVPAAGSELTGGIIGYSVGGNMIINSSSSIDIQGDLYVGGLAGILYGGSLITNSYSTGKVTGTDRVGGLVGYTQNDLAPASFTVKRAFIVDSYATGEVFAPTATYVGGLVGQLIHAYVIRCYATGAVNGRISVGGFVGLNWRSDIIQSFSTGNVTGNTATNGRIGRFAGETSTGVFTSNYFNGNSTLTNTLAGTFRAPGAGETAVDVGGVSPADYFYMNTNAPMSFWDFLGTGDGTNNIWRTQTGNYPHHWYEVEESYTAPFVGEGTLESPYLISTAADLNNINSHPQLMKKVFELTQDIDLSGYDGVGMNPRYTSIGGLSQPFMGTFIGNRHEISSLTISSTNHITGMFGVIAGADLLGVNLTSVRITSTRSFTGSIAGFANGVYLDRSSVTGDGTVAVDIQGTTANAEYLGGLFGFLGSTSNNIRNSYVKDMNIQGLRYTGGIAGYSIGSSNINKSYFSGSVVGTIYTSGVIGQLANYASNFRGVFMNATVSGNSATNETVGRTLTGTSPVTSPIYFNSTLSFTNGGAGTLHTGGVAVDVGGTDPANYFYDSSSAAFTPVGFEWDFTEIWQENATDYPSLRD